MKCRSYGLSVICIPAAVMLACSSFTLADDRSKRGRSLLAQHCSSCHAIGRTGQSPLLPAPPFRKIGDRLDINDLPERMREGLSSAHRDMPTFRFSREDARAIRSYLNSIQE